MSGTIDDINQANHRLIIEISEKNKGSACFELFGVLPEKQAGKVKRTFLYKGRKFLVALTDITDKDTDD